MDEEAAGDEREPESGAPDTEIELNPDVTRISPDGTVRIPENVREAFGLEAGDQVLFVPTDDGLLLRTLRLPTVGEYAEWLEDHAEELDLSHEEVADLLHRYIAGEERDGGDDGERA